MKTYQNNVLFKLIIMLPTGSGN